MMKSVYNVIRRAYLDDFLIIADTMCDCSRRLRLLISTLRALGFNINWSKVEGPSQRSTF